MSELINARNGRSDLRWHLLGTASALALIGSFSATPGAKAEDNADHPTIWIELGGQLEQQTGQGDVFSPSFVTDNPTSIAFQPVSPLHVEKAPIFSNGANANITFQPENTNWVFSAAVRYGRSAGRKSFHQNHVISHQGHETNLHFKSSRGIYLTYKTVTQHPSLTAGVEDTQRQSHAIIDFAAGKDFGLGMFGKGAVSDFNIGVRFAQFVSKVSGAMQARPDAIFTQHDNPYAYYYYHTRFPLAKFGQPCLNQHLATAMFQSQRNFHGVGPALSWNASLPVLGQLQAGTLNVDWGANASVLFGRQRASGSHHTYVYYRRTAFRAIQTHHSSDGSFNRSRTVVVPNIGGFAGLSFNFTNAKVALGYRGDFFFGAMDTGNDTRKTKTVDFYGPFASISIGIAG